MNLAWNNSMYAYLLGSVKFFQTILEWSEYYKANIQKLLIRFNFLWFSRWIHQILCISIEVQQQRVFFASLSYIFYLVWIFLYSHLLIFFFQNSQLQLFIQLPLSSPTSHQTPLFILSFSFSLPSLHLLLFFFQPPFTSPNKPPLTSAFPLYIMNWFATHACL